MTGGRVSEQWGIMVGCGWTSWTASGGLAAGSVTRIEWDKEFWNEEGLQLTLLQVCLFHWNWTLKTPDTYPCFVCLCADAYNLNQHTSCPLRSVLNEECHVFHCQCHKHAGFLIGLLFRKIFATCLYVFFLGSRGH